MVVNHNILLELIEKRPSGFIQEIKAKKYKYIYNDTYEYILNNFSGKTFSEKCYKFIYGIKSVGKCKICNCETKYRSFFVGYKIYCSKKCLYNDPGRIRKIKQTKLSRYGNENYNNVEKYKNTMMHIYKVNHNWCGKYGNRRCDKTKIKNHGSLSYNNNDKRKQTCIKKFGVDSFSKTTNFRKSQSKKLLNLKYQIKMADGMEKKYGVRYSTQVPEIAIRCQNGKWHNCKLPSGKIIKLQGYEPRALKILLENYNESEIKYKKSDMPVLWYNNKRNKYYPDFYIPKDKLVIEVKSKYTLHRDKNKNKMKFKSVKMAGYNFKLIIF